MLSDDIMWGADAVQEYTKAPLRTVYQWADDFAEGKPVPPVRKEGRRIYALRSQLDRHFGLTQAAPARSAPAQQPIAS